jgi:hypothetical protein
MFTVDSPWSNAARATKAFKISTQFALHSTDEQLTTLIRDLQRRHIALALEAGLLVGSGRCGMGVEGYGLENSAENVAKRIKSHGGQLDYIAFDEPVWHGHEGLGKTGGGALFCSDAISDLVDQMVPKLALLHQYFPNAEFGDIDPIHGRHPEAANDILAFFDLLREKSQLRISFFHADIAWQAPGWQPVLEQLSVGLHKRGLRVGIICDGGGSAVKGEEARSNDAWVHSAIQRCQALAKNPQIRPDDFIVQSWEPLPTRILPETDPGSLTYEVNAVAKLSR